MKFDAIVGNPPYQGENHSQIYPFFYTNAIKIANNYVTLIFPVGWQQPKNANNLKVLNNEEIKTDKQIVSINNVQNVFPTVTGAEWVNIILWKKSFDNGLNGDQLIYTNGLDPREISLVWEANSEEKPREIQELAKIVTGSLYFESLQNLTSVLKPYGLRTDVFEDPKKYKIDSSLLYDKRMNSNDYLVYCKNSTIRFIDMRVLLPKVSKATEKYKVFVGYAWGNMSEKTGLGGAFSDIIIGLPHQICTETYLESGCFDSFDKAKKHAKYLMTKFARALLYMNKYSQHSTTAWGAVPVQDYHEDWWNKSIAEIDEELFKKYAVSEEVAQFVRDNIQTKTEANIVNYELK